MFLVRAMEEGESDDLLRPTQTPPTNPQSQLTYWKGGGAAEELGKGSI